MVRRFIVKVLVSAVALWAAAYVLPGFSVSGGITGYLIAGLVLGTLNTFVRPILKLISFPIILVTLGLFTVVINIGILWLVSYLLPTTVVITGIGSLFWATFIISLVQTIFDPKKS